MRRLIEQHGDLAEKIARLRVLAAEEDSFSCRLTTSGKQPRTSFPEGMFRSRRIFLARCAASAAAATIEIPELQG